MKWKGLCTPVSVRVDHTYVFPFCLTVGDQYKSKGYINSWIHNGIWNLNVGSWWGEYTIQFIQLSLSVKSSSAWNVGHWSTLNLEANTVTKIRSYFGPSGVRALPLAAGINEGGHYFSYFSTSFLGVGTAVIQNHRRGCRRVSNFCIGPPKK